jgi:hypothetical protein
MNKRRIDALRSLVETGLKAVVFTSLVRRIGARRLGRIAAFAGEGYLAKAGRSRRRRAG